MGGAFLSLSSPLTTIPRLAQGSQPWVTGVFPKVPPGSGVLEVIQGMAVRPTRYENNTHFYHENKRGTVTTKGLIAIASLLLLIPAALCAQQHDDFDEYILRIGTVWFYSNPSGYIHGTLSGDSAAVDFQKNLGFNSYSTFTGKVDWKFTRKNHFYVALTPFYSSSQTTITQDFQFQGQLFKTTMVVQSNLHAFLVAPGYQYDIIRRKRGHLGIGVQMDLLNYSGKISAAAQVIGTPPVNYGPLSASGSVLAPIPVVGPEFRFYLTDSPKVYVEGNVYGMYFFGYGNMVTTASPWE